MTNEDQQPTPEPSQDIVPVEDGVRNRKGVLEKLPLEIRNDMDDFMHSHSVSAAPKYMAEKYGEQFPFLLKLTKPSFYRYFKRHNLKMKQELAVLSNITSTPPELLTVIETTTDLSSTLQDKRAAFIALFKDCEATSKMLQQQQANFIDPQIQQVILNNRKQMCTIIEKLSVLNNQLTEESTTDWLREAEILMGIFYGAVVNCYKITHPDQSKMLEFLSGLTEHLTILMKSYKETKENYIKATS